jgi:anti-sigma factor RsiW
MNAPELPEETSKVEDLSAWIDGELTRDSMEKLEHDVAHDPKLRAEATRLKAAWDLLDHLPKPVASHDLTNRTMAMLQICDTTTQRFEPSSQFASVKPRGILQLGLWWALLAFLVVGGYGIARYAMFSPSRSIKIPLARHGFRCARIPWRSGIPSLACATWPVWE